MKKERGIIIAYLEQYTNLYFIAFGLLEVSSVADMLMLSFKFMTMETPSSKKCWKILHLYLLENGCQKSWWTKFLATSFLPLPIFLILQLAAWIWMPLLRVNVLCKVLVNRKKEFLLIGSEVIFLNQ